MQTKRKTLRALLNGNIIALNQLPRITLLCVTDNLNNSIYIVNSPRGLTLPLWAKPKMTKEEIEGLQAKYNVLVIEINKTYPINE